jgi:hypothetical protein
MAPSVACGGVLVLLLQVAGTTVPGTHHQLPHRGLNGAVADADLLAYSRSPFDKAEMMHKTVVLGTHLGNKLIAEFPCSDVCPDYTARVIRYDLAAGEVCVAKGGALREVYVPYGIAMVKREYCIPPILAAKPSGRAPK